MKYALKNDVAVETDAVEIKIDSRRNEHFMAKAAEVLSGVAEMWLVGRFRVFPPSDTTSFDVEVVTLHGTVTKNQSARDGVRCWELLRTGTVPLKRRCVGGKIYMISKKIINSHQGQERMTSGLDVMFVAKSREVAAS